MSAAALPPALRTKQSTLTDFYTAASNSTDDPIRFVHLAGPPWIAPADLGSKKLHHVVTNCWMAMLQPEMSDFFGPYLVDLYLLAYSSVASCASTSCIYE
ncbi:hypothetical protein CVM73_38355 [Bradyrhizobium forestalis]|uniref:Uncharacterized protein n=1 Tax=Bradyrhizobium forestalis TaxID=1419263 RepID=A0A2M8QWW6_9BRAD|nr:hypothetical protein CVM73_38355 [Bradyrhizobium forestalis]